MDYLELPQAHEEEVLAQRMQRFLDAAYKAIKAWGCEPPQKDEPCGALRVQLKQLLRGCELRTQY